MNYYKTKKPTLGRLSAVLKSSQTSDTLFGGGRNTLRISYVACARGFTDPLMGPDDLHLVINVEHKSIVTNDLQLRSSASVCYFYLTLNKYIIC